MSYNQAFLNHKTGQHHPENPGRLTSILKKLEREKIWEKTNKINPSDIEHQLLTEIHPEQYVKQIKNRSMAGGGRYDADTVISSGTYKAAIKSCGALKTLVDRAIDKNESGIALTRPPGHHALPKKAMGFCIFNSISIAAKYAEKKSQKTVIFDWDVHHGNGTQEIFYEQKNPLYISIHQTPLFPGTGSLNETGKNNGAGYNINIPLPSGMEDQDYNYIMDEIITPKINEYNPDLILVSAGFDGHKKDPLAGMELTSKAYKQMTKKLKTHKKPIIMALEGGYNHQALQNSINQVLQAMEVTPSQPEKPKEEKPKESTKNTARKIKKTHRIP
nr:histone deacetylase [Methanonatronarchaeum sp. AMET6-2]